MSVPTKRISDLFTDVKIGGTPSRGNPAYFDGENLWVSIKDMEGQPLIYKTAEVISDEGVRNSNCKLVKKGSLLFSFKLTVGRIAFAGADLYTNEAIAAFDRDEAELAGVDLEYLSLVLPIAAREDTTKNSMGAALLNKDKILNLAIPVLEIDDQRQIAARLKAQLAEVETARQAVQVQLRDAGLLRQRLLQQAFDALADVSMVPIKEIAHIQLGKMLSPKAKTGKEPSIYLRNQNVQWGRFDLLDMAKMDFDSREREKFSLRKGDVLICEGGEPGRCAVWNEELENCFYQKALHRLRPQVGVADSEFLAFWLRFQADVGAFSDKNAKTTIAHLPLTRLEQLPVPDIDINLQRSIVARLKQQLAEADALRIALEDQQCDLDALPQRILAQAFED